MRAMMCLGAVLFLASCDASKQQLASTQASLADVTKERDELKTKVQSVQEQLDAAKKQLAQAKTTPAAATGAVAAKTPDAKATAPGPAAGKSARAKHAHKS